MLRGYPGGTPPARLADVWFIRKMTPDWRPGRTACWAQRQPPPGRGGGGRSSRQPSSGPWWCSEAFSDPSRTPSGRRPRAVGQAGRRAWSQAVRRARPPTELARRRGPRPASWLGRRPAVRLSGSPRALPGMGHPGRERRPAGLPQLRLTGGPRDRPRDARRLPTRQEDPPTAWLRGPPSPGPAGATVRLRPRPPGRRASSHSRLPTPPGRQ